jgi:hypothetical protein
MKSIFFKMAGISLSVMSIVSCGEANSEKNMSADSVATEEHSHNMEARPAGEWVNLFDGKTLNGWHGYNKEGAVTNWKVEDSALVCGGVAKDAHGGDLVTDKDYGNFELTWDWKIPKAANSGVMYHVIEDKKYEAPYNTGPEYQIIDDKDFPEKLDETQKSGADYAMTAANDKKKLNPVGEWNSSKLVVNNGHVEHWLNGEKVVEFEAGSDSWNKLRKEGKWKDYPAYGTAKTGKIALQDHGTKLYYKNIKIREL